MAEEIRAPLKIGQSIFRVERPRDRSGGRPRKGQPKKKKSKTKEEKGKLIDIRI